MSAPKNEVDALAAMLGAIERRIDQHDAHVDVLVDRAVNKAVAQMTSTLLTEEERLWVKLALQAQAQRVKLRQSIIDKTLTALIWAALLWAGTILLEYIKAHGWKP